MKKFIVANWKCHPAAVEEAKALFNSVTKGVNNIKNKGEVVICPPFVYLPILKANGAQDVFWCDGGAHTGEISPSMLESVGVKYVIVGHSERRRLFKETNEIVVKKLEAVLVKGLIPILCIDKISQIPGSLSKKVIIAYEPLSAIGTGKPCSPSEARKMRLAIEQAVGGVNPILYGGSVNSQNAQDYIAQVGFQGLLVGKASLQSKEFVDIVKKACYC